MVNIFSIMAPFFREATRSFLLRRFIGAAKGLKETEVIRAAMQTGFLAPNWHIQTGRQLLVAIEMEIQRRIENRSNTDWINHINVLCNNIDKGELD